MAYYMNKSVPAKRGDIFYISNSKCYATDPSNTEGRPAIVVSSDKLNEHADVVEVVYLTTKEKWQKWLKKDEIRLFNHGVKVENASLLERLKARIAESAIKVSTVKAPHTYMKAVGTRELEKILEEELGNEDTKRHTC